MSNNIFISGFCNNERVFAISEIQKTINKYGYIIDFKFFSDISISIKIEIEELNIDKLFCDLKSFISLNDFEVFNSSSIKERVIFFNITFIKGTGDMKIETPAVPG